MSFIKNFIKILITSSNKNLDTISKKIEATTEKTSELKSLQRGIYALQKQLIENQNKLSSIITTATDAIIVLNINGEVILWNKAAEIMFQYTIDEIYKHGIGIIMDISDFGKHTYRITELKNKFEYDKSVSISNKLVLKNAIKKDGTVFPVEISISSWKNNGDIYFTGIIRDLSEREEILKKLYTLETINSLIIKNVPDGIVVYDLDLNVLSWNPIMEKITTVKSEEIIGKNIYDIFPGLKGSEMSEIFDVVLSGTEKRGPLTLYKNKEGEEKYIKGTFSPLYDPQRNKIIGVVEILRIFSLDEVRTPETVQHMNWTGKKIVE